MSRSFHQPGRSAVFGTKAMIATSHPDASLVGIDMLRRGGSAIDAALAATAMLCVVEPAMTGIGGDCFAIVARPGDPPVCINGSGRAPAGATIDKAHARRLATIVDDSPFAVTIPGAVDAWCRLHADYGRLPLSEVLEPAARKAEDGFVVAPRVAFDWARHASRLGRHQTTARQFLHGGRAPREGELQGHRALAATLRKIGKHGRSAFYEGEVAADIIETLTPLGGTHTEEDFAAQASNYEVPISTRFQGMDILECPPNGQGATALLMLNALHGWERWTKCTDPTEREHIFAEVTRAAYALRDRAITDPACMPITVDEFLSEPSVAFVRNGARGSNRFDLPPHAPWETDTICLSVVDQDGLVVSFINSLFVAFGSTLYAPKAGVLLHSRGTSFSLDPKHPNSLDGRKRPMHTIIPGMVAQNGRPVMPFGVMGGQYQSAGHAHFLTRLYEQGMDLQSAIDAPRQFATAGSLQVEESYDANVVEGLKARGHNIEIVEVPLGGAQAVQIDHERGVLIGGSDARKDGCAMGY